MKIIKNLLKLFIFSIINVSYAFAVSQPELYLKPVENNTFDIISRSDEYNDISIYIKRYYDHTYGSYHLRARTSNGYIYFDKQINLTDFTNIPYGWFIIYMQAKTKTGETKILKYVAFIKNGPHTSKLSKDYIIGIQKSQKTVTIVVPIQNPDRANNQTIKAILEFDHIDYKKVANVYYVSQSSHTSGLYIGHKLYENKNVYVYCREEAVIFTKSINVNNKALLLKTIYKDSSNKDVYRVDMFDMDANQEENKTCILFTIRK